MARSGPGPDSGARVPLSIWDLPEQGGRGPRPKHSRAAIAAAAVSLADAEGIDAVTMRRMAADLGMGTMSLYNYVPTKEHLVQLMIDEVSSGTAPRPSSTRSPGGAPGPGPAGLGHAHRHPWLPRIMQRPPVIGAARYVTSTASSAC